MTAFPHLKLPYKIAGIKKNSGGGGGRKDDRTIQNLANRTQHGTYLKTATTHLLTNWTNLIAQKQSQGIEIPNQNDISVFLRVDTEVFPIESLAHWGIEIIAEEENGYIIGASTDRLAAFNANVDQFLAGQGKRKDTAAKIWDLEDSFQWRLKNLVKGDLQTDWDQIEEGQQYYIEIGVSCSVLNKLEYPDENDFDSQAAFTVALAKFKSDEKDLWLARDKKQLEREDEIEGYAKLYNGEVIDEWDNGEDAIFFKVRLSGLGLKDIVQTYQYLYSAAFSQQFAVDNTTVENDANFDVILLPPSQDATKVCVIDSGIQESHRLLAPAIDGGASRSYVRTDTDVSDKFRQTGHGTKVAGAVLYPRNIPATGTHQLEAFLQNARILDERNRISDREFGPTLMEKIVSDFAPTRVFNLSVAEHNCYVGSHMPALAASIDKLIHEKNVLFLVAAGNLYRTTQDHQNPGVKEYLDQGKAYPTYLDESHAGIANPGVSSFAITVGSIAHAAYEDQDYKSMADAHCVSAFSRTGLGMWGAIKPDVVEFGGDLVRNKTTNDLISHQDTSPELVNSTLYNAPATGKDDFGTSFSTPKVSYIACRLQKELPTESALMYRALIVQSARLPAHCFNNPTFNDIRYYGYGLPDIDRAINNSSRRITFIQNGTQTPGKADLYRINIPRELRGESGTRLLVEVSLSFSAKVRTTRKGAHQYLSSWLEWKSSKYNEKFETFRNRTINYLETGDNQPELLQEGGAAIQWVLRENPAWSRRTGIEVNRNNSTIQKSWAIIESHQFEENFGLAVIGQKGWDKNMENSIPYAICVSFEIVGSETEIYELIAKAQIEVPVEQEIDS